MDIREAIKILKDHNKWRRGDDSIDIGNPTELGIAIDTIINYLESNKFTLEQENAVFGVINYLFKKENLNKTFTRENIFKIIKQNL